MTAPRAEVRGATIALTRRTNLRKTMLAPWHPLVDGIWWYALAWAQQQTGVAVHQSTLVLNHHHTEVTGHEPNLPVFRRLLHGEFSKALNTLLAHERYDQPRQLWDDRPTHAMRLLDADAQAAQMIYGHVNCVAAGLVTTPSDMPGWTFDFGLWKTGTVWVKRPPLHFESATHPDKLGLRFTPPPLLYRELDGNLDALVHHMRRLTDDAVRHLHQARKGRPVLGARKLRRIHPWNEPRTMRESGGARVPTFKLGAQGLTARTTRIIGCLETTQFRREHREARLARCAGDDVEFPHGTYLMRVQHGVRVAEPREDAVVTAAGPTLDEVRIELAARTSASTSSRSMPEPRRLLEEVRCAFRLEAADLAQTDELELDTVAQVANAQDLHNPNGAPEPTGPHVQHRFARTEERGLTARLPARLIVLRDRRRGRPALPATSDPPV